VDQHTDSQKVSSFQTSFRRNTLQLGGTGLGWRSFKNKHYVFCCYRNRKYFI